MNYTCVESDAALEDVCKALAEEPVIGVDLEADSMHCFKDKICLIQIASGKGEYLVDPFEISNIEPFADLLENEKVCKIFHGSDFDIRSLDRDYGARIRNLFDTEIACRFLGITERGLGALIKRYFDIQLDKKFQKEDWSVRPLRPEMVEYSLKDVAYLIELHEQLKTKLENCGRMAWAKEEFEIQTQIRYENNHAPPLFKRFKGAGKMDNRTLAVLENLLEERLKIAEEKDRPLFKVMSNKSLSDMAYQKPANVGTIVENRMLSPKQADMYGSVCLKAVKDAMGLPHGKLPSYPRIRRPRPDKTVTARVARLKTMREKLSTSLGMEPGFLLNNALIGVIAHECPRDEKALESIDGIRKWQVQAIGKHILEQLEY